MSELIFHSEGVLRRLQTMSDGGVRVIFDTQELSPANAAVEPEKPRIDGFWEPKVGDGQWFLTANCDISCEHIVTSYRQSALQKAAHGNSFPSEEAAQMALLRRQSMRIDWVPRHAFLGDSIY